MFMKRSRWSSYLKLLRVLHLPHPPVFKQLQQIMSLNVRLFQDSPAVTLAATLAV